MTAKDYFMIKLAAEKTTWQKVKKRVGTLGKVKTKKKLKVIKKQIRASKPKSEKEKAVEKI